MDSERADAIAQAILEPNLHAQAALHQTRMDAVRRRARQGRVAAFGLLGGIAGALIAHLVGGRPVIGFIWGNVAVAAVAWPLVWLRASRDGISRNVRPQS